MAELHNSILESIGRTPVVRLNRLAEGLAAEVYVKCEFLNPGGSVKDRIGLELIEDAERRGLLKPGGTLVEATSGNTGVGLAMAASIKGYRTIFVLPDKVSEEKIRTLRAFGAQVVTTPTAVAPEDPRSYYCVSRRIAEETPGAFYVNQYHNPANPLAHYKTTGPEIWEQTDGTISALVVGMGTGGTISGCGRYLKERNPRVQVIGVDPDGSLYHDYIKDERVGEARSYLIEGIGEDFFPSTMDFRVVDDVVRVFDREAFVMTRRLLSEEGLFVGISSGAAVAGALRYAAERPAGERIVVILPDSGTRYLSKVWDEGWMQAAGFLDTAGRVSDLLEEAPSQRAVVLARMGEPISEVLRRMKQHGLDELPVLEGERVVGMVHELDLVQRLLEGHRAPTDAIDGLVSERFRAVTPSDPIERLPEIFYNSRTALVLEGNALRAMLTPRDLQGYLAGKA
jgi:cystathionine beta-synthase